MIIAVVTKYRKKSGDRILKKKLKFQLTHVVIFKPRDNILMSEESVSFSRKT